MSEKKVSFTIRAEPSLRDAFLSAAEANHRPGALLLRDFMRDYIKRNAQGDMFTGKPDTPTLHERRVAGAEAAKRIKARKAR